jgi:hypothetical protein
MQDALYVRVPVIRRGQGYDDDQLQADAAEYIAAIFGQAESRNPGGEYALGDPVTWGLSQFRLELADAISKIEPVAAGAVELAELILRRIDDAQTSV